MARLEELGREVREFHIAGEGGEYETLVLDAPFFGSRIEVLESHVERAGSQAVWVVDRAKLTQKRSGQAGPRTVGKDI
jgi:diphthamide synthase (EF-2-diphthine--ammonia ligase)